ncbi:MAG: glycosyltransferase family 2 protein, partial [Desulfovibrio sp.]|nr:glycosyltransferase family 2 protein [Desulfovibrio sp.]
MNTYEGAFQLNGTGVSGWASAQDGSSPIWVEALVDGLVMGIVRADLQEPNGCGFFLPLPSTALGDGSELRMRVANTETYIGESLSLDTAQNACGIEGELHVDRGLTITGWAVDSLAPDTVLRIYAVVNDEIVAETLAKGRRYRPAQGDGHGFTLHLPLKLADGQEHVVKIQDAQKRALPGSPIAFRVWPEHIAQWIERTDHFEKEERTLLAALVQRMEPNMPGACSSHGVEYAAWQEAFPVPKPQGTCRISLDLPCCTAKHSAQILRGQKGIASKPKASSSYSLLLRDGERLHPHALAHMVYTQQTTGAGLVYADSEQLPDVTPCFRPSWDEDFFWSSDYLGPFMVTREVSEATPHTDDESYWAFRARLVHSASKLGGIRHLPQILSQDLPVPADTGRFSAVQEWVASVQPDALVEEQDGMNRVRWSTASLPSVSIIIPTRDRADLLRPCLESLYKTHYEELEILIVDNDSQEEDAVAFLTETAKKSNTRVISYPGLFNYAAINNFAVREATGDYICFLNNDTEAVDPAWLQEMASLLASREEIGCVGAKLLWPNNLVQHAGVLVGTHQLASHIGNQWTADEPGYLLCNKIVCQRSAVTAACLLTPKALFEELGGFDAHRFPVAFNDVDYCLRVRQAGKKILWTP